MKKLAFILTAIFLFSGCNSAPSVIPFSITKDQIAPLYSIASIPPITETQTQTSIQTQTVTKTPSATTQTQLQTLTQTQFVTQSFTVTTQVVQTQTKTTLPSFIEAKVTRVVDGDTIEVEITGKEYTVRYIGMDTPETVNPTQPVQYFGIEASNKNKELVTGKTVRLEKDVSETDRYGRLLRYVYVGELFINAELVRLGYAQVATYPPDVKYQDLFLQLQREAREANRGLWGVSIIPTTSKPTTTGVYVGSIKSDKYHYPSCASVKSILPENIIWFSSVADAKATGYGPCGVCKPPAN